MVKLDATIGGGITTAPAHAVKGASVTPSFARPRVAVFRVSYDQGMTGHVQVVSVRTGKVVRTLPASGFAWVVRSHGRDDHGQLVAPGPTGCGRWPACGVRSSPSWTRCGRAGW